MLILRCISRNCNTENEHDISDECFNGYKGNKVMKENEIYWQVVWVDRAGRKELVEALCGSEEEALRMKERISSVGEP